MTRALSRRRALQALAAAGVGLHPLGVALGKTKRRRKRPSFRHGVASGDPLPDRVILWTRVGSAAASVPVTWEIARDRRFRHVVLRGSTTARRRHDHTVKVDAKGLDAGTRYFFRFRAGGARSPVGRTRTAPRGPVRAARLIVATCGDYSRGLFNAYARIAERDDIDAVVHLGDYIYEADRKNGVRRHEPARECVTLADYRRRYASYRADPQLAAMHARHPVIWVWDDHETVDGTWRGGADPADHDPAEHGPFAARKAAALQAALEWLPIRLPDPGRPERIYRRFAFGDLVDLIMIDTRRIGRDRQCAGNVEGEFFRQTGEFADPGRHLLGAEQERWLTERLAGSRACWRLIGNQVVLSPIKVTGAPEATGASVYANPDQWDGYAPARRRVLDALERDGVEDLVVLTGDVHASMAYEITDDPNDLAAYDPVTGRGSYGVEFVAPSISSAGDPQDPEDAEGVVERLMQEGADALRAPNPHLKYVEAKRNGYLLLDIAEDRLRAEYWLVPTVTQPSDEEELAQAFTVSRGSPRLVAS